MAPTAGRPNRQLTALLRFACGALAVVVGLTQPKTSARPEFEVASIKLNKTNSPLYYKSFSNRFTARNMTAKMLMCLAWQVGDYRVSGGPGWFSSEGFDFEATTERPATWGQMRLMFQSLLADRFKLTFHRQTKEASIYALVTGKSGLKIKLSSDQTRWTGDHPDEPGTTGANMDVQAGSLTGDSIPLALFVNFLASQVDRPIVNKTGFTGRYAINLHWTPDTSQAPPGAEEPPSQPDASSVSLFTAIQDQLGLKLEPAKGPVDLLVIDHVERPSEN
jgi:uncharacterized protein (TIGR03435 family)